MNQLQKFGDASVSSRAVPLAAWPVRQSPWSATAKRIFDVTLALALLVVIAPLLLVIAVLVSLDGGPVLYRHSRVGRGITPFDCLKFRTMIVDADHCLTEYLGHHPKASDEWARDQKLMFDPRITPIGKVLRRTSFDELPQIFNVLRGEMSLVGRGRSPAPSLPATRNMSAHTPAFCPASPACGRSAVATTSATSAASSWMSITCVARHSCST